MKHPFPPERIDWEAWSCPGFYSLFAFVVLIWVIRSKPARRTGILGLLVAATFWFLLMLPRFQGGGELGRRSECRENLSNVGLGIHTYHNEHSQLPQPVILDADRSPVSSRIRLAPYLGEAGPVSDYNEAATWDDASNRPVAQHRLTPYFCRTNRNPMDAQLRYFTAYALLTGGGTSFPVAGPLSFDDISDGLGETLLVGEACGTRIVWTEPRDVAEVEPVRVNLPGAQPESSDGTLSSYHEGGTHALYANGSARFVSEYIDLTVLHVLQTPDGDDDISEF